MTMLDALSKKLQKLKVDFIRIDGKTKTDARPTYIDRFQNEKSCQVAVLSLKGMLYIYNLLFDRSCTSFFIFHIIIKFLQLVMQQSH